MDVQRKLEILADANPHAASQKKVEIWVLTVIARSEATKQSMPQQVETWIASLRSQ